MPATVGSVPITGFDTRTNYHPSGMKKSFILPSASLEIPYKEEDLPIIIKALHECRLHLAIVIDDI